MLDMTMSGMVGWDAAKYLVRDCENPVDHCVVAGEYEDGGINLKYTALDDELLWLVCDSYGHGPRPFTLAGRIDTASPVLPTASVGFSMSAAPNPFNPRTTFSYDLPQDTRVRLKVHSLDGRANAGRYEAVWEGRDLDGRTMPSGVYIARLEAAEDVQAIRVVLLK